MTFGPSRASTPAIAAPIPRAAPVTSAVLPASGWSQSSAPARRPGRAAPAARRRRPTCRTGRTAARIPATPRPRPTAGSRSSRAATPWRRANDAVERLTRRVDGDVVAVGGATEHEHPSGRQPRAPRRRRNVRRPASRTGLRPTASRTAHRALPSPAPSSTSAPLAATSLANAARHLAGSSRAQRAGQQRVAAR